MMVTSLESQAKRLGDLIQKALSVTGKDTTKCAEAIGVSIETFIAYQNGEQSPSLPELEALAFYLDIPVEYFWDRATIKATPAERAMVEQLENLLFLRNRIIGVRLRQARMEAGISYEELERYVGIGPDQLKDYERGETPIPLPELEVISLALNLSLREFQAQSGPVGKWALQKKAIEGFLELPPEMQLFVSKPVNMPYLELAQRLSEMSVDRLRNVAEGLLEITL